MAEIPILRKIRRCTVFKVLNSCAYMPNVFLWDYSMGSDTHLRSLHLIMNFNTSHL